MSRRTLVTGGTGFTGSHLVRALHAGGLPVRVLTRSRGTAESRLPAGVEIVEGDVSRPDAVDAAVRGCSVVFHLATTYREGEASGARHRAVHVEGTRLLLEAARREGVARFVHVSTVGVHSHIADPPADESWPHTPADDYQATKSEAELLALRFQREHGFPLAVARPTAIYGPGDLRLLKLFRMIATGRYVTLGRGDIYYHMVYVDDLVRGLRLLAERPEAVGEVFILGGPSYGTLNELVATIADALDVPVPGLHLPAWPVQLAGSLVENVCRPFGIRPPLYRRRVDFFTKSRAFSIEKARRVLGYRPEVSLEDGIRRTARWYREHGHLPPASGSAR